MAQEYVLVKNESTQNLGQIAVSKSVIERIVDISVSEIEGVVLNDRSFGYNPITIKLTKTSLSVSVDVKLSYTLKVEEISEQLQARILESIELMIGYSLAVVDINIVGFTFN